MSNTLLTIWCILVTLGSLFFIGLPLSLVLNNKKNETISETSWLLAPFLGLGTIVLLTQNLYYLNVPLGKSFCIPWLLGACFWLIALKRFTFRNIISSAPVSVIFIALAVYLIHGAGLLIIGAKYYIGRGWHDQINYTSGAQFLIDYTFHQPIANLSFHPYFVRTLAIVSGDRIGEMFFQGFLACSTFTSAKTVFETAIIALPFFIVLAIYQLAIQLSFTKKTALFATAIAGILPSIALIHLENFLSQALATSLLLVWPVVVAMTFSSATDWRKILIAAVILAAATTIYTEYYLIFLSVAGLYTLMQRSIHQKFLQSVKVLMVTLIALCLNIGFLQGVFTILHRAATTHSLGGIYPWTNSLESLSRLWLNDFVMYLSGKSFFFVNIISLVLFITAYIGYGLKAFREKNNVAAILLFLILFPLIIHSLGANIYAYQYYKLLLSVSPLLVLGVILFSREYLAKFFTSQFGYFCLTIFLVISFCTTLSMIIQSTNISSLTALNLGGAQNLLTIDSQEAQEKISSIKNKDILLNWQDDFFKGNYINGWLTYYTRYNQVWLTNKQVGDINLQSDSASLDSLPNKFILITYTTPISLIVGKSVQPIWHNHAYSEFNIDGNDWALLYSDDDNLSFNIVAGKNGVFTAYVNNGAVLNIPVKKGINHHIKIHPLTLRSLAFHG